MSDSFINALRAEHYIRAQKNGSTRWTRTSGAKLNSGETHTFYYTDREDFPKPERVQGVSTGPQAEAAVFNKTKDDTHFGAFKKKLNICKIQVGQTSFISQLALTNETKWQGLERIHSGSIRILPKYCFQWTVNFDLTITEGTCFNSSHRTMTSKTKLMWASFYSRYVCRLFCSKHLKCQESRMH